MMGASDLPGNGEGGLPEQTGAARTAESLFHEQNNWGKREERAKIRVRRSYEDKDKVSHNHTRQMAGRHKVALVLGEQDI
jgi:hypothetical protein